MASGPGIKGRGQAGRRSSDRGEGGAVGQRSTWGEDLANSGEC